MEKQTKETIKAVKGFNSDMTCTPTEDIKFQYEEGKTYEEETADACHKGFHACELPIDVFRYYPPTKSIYHEVDMFGEIDDSNINKVCSSKIKIGAKINIAGIIKVSVDIIRGKAEKESAASSGDYGNAASSGDYGNAASSGYYGNAVSSGYKGNAASSGDYGNAASSGDYGNAASSGNCGNAVSSGNCSNAASSGDYGNAASSGYYGNAVSSGDYGNAVSSGDYGNAASSGYKGNAASSGDYGNAVSSGNCSNAASSGYKGSAKANHPNSCAIAWGPESKASGVIGSHLVLAEWESNGSNYWNEKTWIFRGAKMVVVDGKNIKENAWYKLRNGEVVECDD